MAKKSLFTLPADGRSKCPQLITLDTSNALQCLNMVYAWLIAVNNAIAAAINNTDWASSGKMPQANNVYPFVCRVYWKGFGTDYGSCMQQALDRGQTTFLVAVQ
jgi:hypothetical protein